MNLCFMRVFGGLKYVYKPVAIQEPNGFNLSFFFFFFSSAPSCHAVWTTENAKHKLIKKKKKIKNSRIKKNEINKLKNLAIQRKSFFFLPKGPRRYLLFTRRSLMLTLKLRLLGTKEENTRLPDYFQLPRTLKPYHTDSCHAVIL